MGLFRNLALVALASFCSASFGQETFKCKIAGSVVFQDRPCPGAARRSDDLPKLDSQGRSNSESVSPAQSVQAKDGQQPTDLDRQKAYLARRAKEKKVSDLQSQIEAQQARIEQSRRNMSSELAALDRKASSANNNLAGATYLQSIATEKQAVTSRYNVDIATQRDRLNELRDELERARSE